MGFLLGEIIDTTSRRPRVEVRVTDGLKLPCWHKRAWTEEEATAKMQSLLQAPYVKDRHRLNVYRCPYCERFHVGRDRDHTRREP